METIPAIKMMFDFDYTLGPLRIQEFPFPPEGYIISSRPIDDKDMISHELLRMGYTNYPLIINERNKMGSNRDMGAMFKAHKIIELGINKYFDDSEYQLRIIARYLERKKYICQLNVVSAMGIAPFNLRKWING